jgi:hypothetical protein
MAKRNKELMRALEAAGAVFLRNTNHEIWKLPNGHNFVMPNTASDHRNTKNALRDLRRAAAQPKREGK